MKTTNRNVPGNGVTHLHVTTEPARAVRPVFLKLLTLAVLVAAVWGGCSHGGG